jgi:hypothetical protein
VQRLRFDLHVIHFSIQSNINRRNRNWKRTTTSLCTTRIFARPPSSSFQPQKSHRYAINFIYLSIANDISIRFSIQIVTLFLFYR